MNSYVKKIYYLLPKAFKRVILKAYEDYYRSWSFREIEEKPVVFLPHNKNPKPRILFYFISGLSYGGVAKAMQIFAKHLDFSKFEVYFMYSSKARAISGNNEREDNRRFYLENTPVHLIEHTYDSIDQKHPFVIHNMKPSFLEIIKKYNIDLLITTSSGYAEFPFNLVTDLPIINLNIFGSPIVQANVLYSICISKEVADRIKDIVHSDQIKIIYLPSEEPILGSEELGKKLRQRFGFEDSDIVFGRIGRGVDQIFDFIGIRAFQQTVKRYANTHYLIMSPPPILEKLVKEEKIPNVNFLPASGKEEDIWSFHQAIDVLAHFRRDGESCGLNIAESMLCGKPILTHRSHYWNAHLEYLDESFSKVAAADNIQQYAEFMEFFIRLTPEERKRMGERARQKARQTFLIKNTIKEFEKIINQALAKE